MRLSLILSTRAKEAVEKLTGDQVTAKRELFGPVYDFVFDHNRHMLTPDASRLRQEWMSMVSCLLYVVMQRGVAPAATRIITHIRCTAFWLGDTHGRARFFTRRTDRGCGTNAAFTMPKIMTLQRLRLRISFLCTGRRQPMPFNLPNAALYPSA